MPQHSNQPEPDDAYDVFISYSSFDIVEAEALERRLTEEGLRVWRDNTRLKAGEHVGSAIPDALRSAGAVTVIWSDNSIASDYVRFETDYAIGAGKFAAVAVNGFDYRKLNSFVRDFHCEKLPEVLVNPGKLKARILELGRAPYAGQQIRHADIRPVPGFTGRKEMLAALEAKLWRDGSKATVAIRNATGVAVAMRGLGGVGKTVLARHYAWEQRGRYYGIWWLRAEDHDTLIDDLTALGRRMGLRFPDDMEPEDAAHLTLDAIAQRCTPKPWLLIYDNVEDKVLVRRFTPPENAHIFYTTRLPNWFGEAEELPVDIFPLDTAIEFLLAHAPGETRETAKQLAEALGCLPLALAHARAYCKVRGWPFSRYQDRLVGLLDTLPKGVDSDYPKTVHATFSLAMDRAAEECAAAPQLMGLIAHFAPDQIPLWLIPETAMPEEMRDDALEALQRLSLIAREALADGSPAISVHRLVQEVVRARLREAGEVEANAVEATRIVESGYDDSGSFDAAARNTVWLPHALAVLAHAPREGDAAWHTLWTCNQIGDVRVNRGELARAREFFEIGLTVAKGLADASPENKQWQRDVSISLNKIADVLRNAGDAKGALEKYQKSLAIAEALAAADPDRPEWQRDIAISCSRVGMVAAQQGQASEALGWFRKGRDILARLTQIMPDDAGLPKQLAVFDQLITGLDNGAEPAVKRSGWLSRWFGGSKS